MSLLGFLPGEVAFLESVKGASSAQRLKQLRRHITTDSQKDG
jgi:hypothetical protein